MFSWIPDLLLALEEMPSPIRILTAVPICDGHDSAINTVTRNKAPKSIPAFVASFTNVLRRDMKIPLSKTLLNKEVARFREPQISSFRMAARIPCDYAMPQIRTSQQRFCAFDLTFIITNRNASVFQSFHPLFASQTVPQASYRLETFSST